MKDMLSPLTAFRTHELEDRPLAEFSPIGGCSVQVAVLVEDEIAGGSLPIMASSKCVDHFELPVTGFVKPLEDCARVVGTSQSCGPIAGCGKISD
jgi:hypothetical protein